MSKYKGEISLGAAVIGLILTLSLTPTEPGLWYEILLHGFEAATVGALADWLAVKMIFDEIKLGRVRLVPASGIIPRKQEAIAKAAGKLVADEWLSKASIRRLLDELDFSEMLADEMARWRGAGIRTTHVAKALADLLDTPEFRSQLADMIEDGSARIKPSDWFARHITPPDIEKRVNRLLPPVVERLIALTQTQEVYDAVLQLMKSEQRGFLKQLLFDPVEATDKTLLKIRQFLTDIQKDNNHPIRANLVQSVYEWVQTTEIDVMAADVLKDISSSGIVDHAVDHAVREFRSLEGPSVVRLQSFVHEVLKHLEGSVRSTWRDEVNSAFRSGLGEWMEKYHHQIGDMVERNIRQLSPTAIKDQFRTRTYNEMQWIRVNGAMAGFLIGCMLGAIRTMIS